MGEPISPAGARSVRHHVTVWMARPERFELPTLRFEGNSRVRQPEGGEPKCRIVALMLSGLIKSVRLVRRRAVAAW
jgi:hypothetical protein